MFPLLKRFCQDSPIIADSALPYLFQPFQPNDVSLAEHPYLKDLRTSMRPTATVRDDGVAIVPINGVLARNPDVYELCYGVEDTSAIYEMLQSCFTNSAVKSLVTAIDSPGGFYTGGADIADMITTMKQATGKRVVSWSGGQMCSLAFWIGCKADEVIGTRSASFGSIGSYSTIYDVSKMMEKFGVSVEVIANKEASLKTIGIPGTSLSDEQRKAVQQRNQDVYEEFKAAVLASRPNVDVDALKGQSVNGAKAKELGLIDRVGDLSFAVWSAKNGK